MRYTPEIVVKVEDNEIFVYGSNQYAIHGAGSAKAALNFGAIYKDVPIGLCGQSYGIITKSFSDVPVTIEFIYIQVKVLQEFALLRPDLTFLVTKIGTALAGFTVDEMAAIFRAFEWPDNVVLPIEFHN